MIAPHRDNRQHRPSQDDKSLRRYRRRWKIERLFAWLGNDRCLVVRYEYHAENFQGFAPPPATSSLCCGAIYEMAFSHEEDKTSYRA